MSTRAWLAIGAALVATVIVAAVAWQRTHATSAKAETAFQPNRLNDKVLIASGWTGPELSKILADFTTLYREQLRTDFIYEVHASGAMQRATFPNDIPPWLFLYLVNYAQYPKGFNLDGRSVLAAATATLTPDFELPAQALYGNKALFYVPANDVQFDVVYAQSRGETWEIAFAAGEWKPVGDARMPPALAPLLPR